MYQLRLECDLTTHDKVFHITLPIGTWRILEKLMIQPAMNPIHMLRKRQSQSDILAPLKSMANSN